MKHQQENNSLMKNKETDKKGNKLSNWIQKRRKHNKLENYRHIRLIA
jgi:hypothetical protein